MRNESFTNAIPTNEEDRLRALDEFGLFDTPPEQDFDFIAALAARVFDTPIAVINLIGRDRVHFKAGYGTDLRGVPREISFSASAITGAELLVILDASKDPRFASNPSVAGAPGIRFYAGAPLVANSGEAIGTLCVLDLEAREEFSESDAYTLRDLAKLVMQQMEVRRLQRVGGEARRELKNSERQFQVLVNGVKDYAVCMLDRNGIITSWNAGAEKINGYTAAEIVGQHFSRFHTDVDREAGTPQRSLGVAAEEGRFEAEAWRVRKDGTLFWANVVIHAIHDEKGTLIGFAKITRDITDRRRNDERLRRLAHFDTLTGLANRHYFLTKLDDLINRHPTAILILDLDGFKEINDTLGHQAGDFILKAVANRLENAVAGKGGAARLGGDEFAVILSKPAGPLDASRVADAIIDAFRTSFVWEGQEIQVGVSIGIAVSPSHGNRANELLANGDLALYDAKSKRRKGYSLFQDTFRQSVVARRTCEAELRRAVAEGELELYYHPQVTLADRRIVGAEALLRWNHPQRGVLSPGAFLHVLERSPLAAAVGNWAIREACSFAAAIRAHGHENFGVAVNLFAAQFRAGDLNSVVMSALADNQLPPNHLELEITENIILQHDKATLAALLKLAQMGVRVSFDDYGTGYASLSLLKRYPLTRLKIDQSFIRNLCTDPEDTAVIRAIIYLAESFGLEVLAEGIEREDQERMLREFGCSFGQGYLYAKPLRAAALKTMLDRRANCGNDRADDRPIRRARS